MFCCMKTGLENAIRLAATFKARRPRVTGEARRLSIKIPWDVWAGTTSRPEAVSRAA
jgi:hypothetical protein